MRPPAEGDADASALRCSASGETRRRKLFGIGKHMKVDQAVHSCTAKNQSIKRGRTAPQALQGPAEPEPSGSGYARPLPPKSSRPVRKHGRSYNAKRLP